MKNYLLGILCLVPFLLFGQDFNVYVSDAGNFDQPPWQILKYDADGTNPEVFISDHLNWPQDIFFLEEEGTVLISNFGTNRISKFDANTGDFLSEFAYGIIGPTRMSLGPDSLLYVLQWEGNGLVKRYKFDGTFINNFTSESVPQSIGMDWDAQGNLYVSSYTQDYVRKFDKDGQDLGLFISSNLVGPTNIWFDENGDLLVLDYDGTAVKRFDSNGNYLGEFLSGLSKSEGFAHLPNGNILIGNGATNSVKMFDKDGNYLSDFIAPGLGGLKTPNAVVLRKIKPTGTRSEIKKDLTIISNQANTFEITNRYFDQIIVYNILGQISLKTRGNFIDCQELKRGRYFILAIDNHAVWTGQIQVF
ncbi:MAG: hypothetical protein R2879_08920 [Saprospiraceae bacterium]